VRRNIAILGSTGSIGCNALEVIEHLGPPWRVVAISGHKNSAKLLEQARKYKPEVVVVSDAECDRVFVARLLDVAGEVLVGPRALETVAARSDVDIVIAAVVGAAGLPATLAAAKAGKTIALANKESLVVGGSLVIPAAKQSGATILPVDSEHSAIFQAMLAGRREEVRGIILTASGGPFRNATIAELERATYADALNHPIWRMGAKVTVDSATMFNKGLELIEACWLFGLPPENVKIVVHPESVVHSMVEFVDGSTIAQLSPPDMRTPIQYALTYPDRHSGLGRPLDLTRACSLNFAPPDPVRFPAIDLAYQVARLGGTAGAVFNAANEAAVAAFADGRISLPQISELVGLTIRAHRVQADPSLDDLLEADRWARADVVTRIAIGAQAERTA
jgi:1-deoxy-D-xylulose-5-phosphate reductoisomerase